jgi:hypothetical protein
MIGRHERNILVAESNQSVCDKDPETLNEMPQET